MFQFYLSSIKSYWDLQYITGFKLFQFYLSSIKSLIKEFEKNNLA